MSHSDPLKQIKLDIAWVRQYPDDAMGLEVYESSLLSKSAAEHMLNRTLAGGGYQEYLKHVKFLQRMGANENYD